MGVKSFIISILPKPLLRFIEPQYYKFQLFYSRLRWSLSKKELDPYSIPIVINNYNRLEYLKRLISSLNKRGYMNIIILDNNSTYPPLLEYYDTVENIRIIHLEHNYGYRAIWESGIVKKFWNTFYVYTDSDMEIDDNCPNNFLEYFLEVLDKYPQCHKVGFGLKIDDLPDYFHNKNNVIEHEKQFWDRLVGEGLYHAPIDTTFALYRPYTGTSTNSKKFNIRTGAPYLIRHLPWYIDSTDLSEEELFYTKSLQKPTHWSIQNKNT